MAGTTGLELATSAVTGFGREVRAGKRIEFDERLSGYELEAHTLSPVDLIAIVALGPPKNRQIGRVLDSWTLKQTVNWKARARPAFHPVARFLSNNGSTNRRGTATGGRPYNGLGNGCFLAALGADVARGVLRSATPSPRVSDPLSSY